MDTTDLHSNEFFSKALTGNTSRAERENFEEWLQKSEANTAAFEAYKKVWETAAALKEYDLKTARLNTQIKILEKLKTKKNIFYYWQRIAAILVIPLLIFSVAVYFQFSTIGPAFVENVQTPHGARTSVVLPDGSTVWLNSGSKISYPHRFGKTREITLKGEMYLEVKKSQQPFIVHTAYGNVKVLGTKFDVSAYPGEAFETTLVEGSVSVTNPMTQREITLKPGFQYTLNNGKAVVKKVSSELYTSWKDGKLVFRREPFEQVAKSLERWFNVTIKLEGEPIKNLWYTGTIEMESFTEVLELIKSTTPIEYVFDPKTRVLTISANLKS